MTGLMRKHGKILLAITGSLLMIVFVLPTGRNTDATAATYVRGTLNGKKVTNADLFPAGNDVRVLSAFKIPIQGAFRMPTLLQYFAYYHGLPITPKEEQQAVHWYLLLKEAQSYGIVASEAEVTDIVSKLNLTESELQASLRALGIGNRTLRGAIADALVIGKLAQLTMNSTQISLPEVEYRANHDLATIQVAYATIDGARDWEKSPEPTPEQIKKQFDLYKDVVPTPIPAAPKDPRDLMSQPPAPTPPVINGHNYPFGYKYPDRVKVEFLRFEKSQLAAQMKPTSEDFDAAYNYYSTHPDQFKNDADIASPPSSQPVGPRPATKSWDEVKKDLVQKQFDQRVARLLKKAADRALTLANDSWKNVEVKAGFRTVPEAAKWPDYNRIETDIAGNKDFLGLKPGHTTTDWLGADALAKLPNIGSASLTTPNGPVAFADLATHVRDITGDVKDAFGRFFLQVGPEGPMLTGDNGDLYVYRIIAADKSHSPATVDEVRPQLVEDLKKIAAYEKAQADAKELARKATAGDLLELAKNANIPASVSKNLTQADSIPELGQAPGLVDAAFAMTRDPAATQPNKDGKRYSVTTTFARDNVLKVHVLELKNFAPASPAEFAARRPNMAMQFAMRSRIEFMYSWLNLDSVAKRLKYVPDHPFDSKDEDRG